MTPPRSTVALLLARLLAAAANGAAVTTTSFGAGRSGAPLSTGAPATPCWSALEAACPFEAGDACQRCAAAATSALSRAQCDNPAVAHYCGAMPLWASSDHVAHRTEHLSSARRNLGATSVPRPDLEKGGEEGWRRRWEQPRSAAAAAAAAAAAGAAAKSALTRSPAGALPGDDLAAAVFAGGCVARGGGITTQFICDEAVGAVDVFNASGHLTATFQLGEARGWICAAAAGVGAAVVLAGGGTLGDALHSARADVLDLATGTIREQLMKCTLQPSTSPHPLSVWGCLLVLRLYGCVRACVRAWCGVRMPCRGVSERPE
jgi:hypothetical protein